MKNFLKKLRLFIGYIMPSKNTFADRVTAYIGDDGVGARLLADEFECAVSTVRRWAMNVATPHPKMVILVDHWMETHPR
jgi:hypothetical protein